MNGEALSNPASVPLSRAKRVDKACDHFEAAWKAGPRPVIEEYLAAAAEPERELLLLALLELEVELRAVAGEQPALQEYEQRFPGNIECVRRIFTQGRSVNDDRRRGGQPPTASASSSEDKDEIVEYLPPAADRIFEASTVPAQIGRYKVIRQLGRGTYGTVYLAEDSLMGRRVAIKVPSRKLLASQKAKEQFLTEVRRVARLQHEGIVRAFDFGQETDGACFIVYEFIDGRTLREQMATAAPPLNETARIVMQLAEALHYAHLQELVHRDIKPANILLDANGKPHITDFGLAVREEDLPQERGHLAGTLPYMSPEQVRRQAHHIDGRSDIYSLGVILYELLCGRRPFNGKTEEELEDQILHRQAKPPRQIKESIPPGMEAVCLRALAKPIQDRYPTPGTWRRRLRAPSAPARIGSAIVRGD